jgi:hypothetical protein
MKGVTAEVSSHRPREGNEGLATTRELLGKESADLWGRVKRMSVRDLASKFESGQAAANAAAAKLAQEVLPETIKLPSFEILSCKSTRKMLTEENHMGLFVCSKRLKRSLSWTNQRW